MNTLVSTQSATGLNQVLKFRYIAALLVLIQMGSAAVRGVTYDLANDYSTVSNPHGVWSYGAMTNLGGPFTLFTSETPGVSQNGVTVDD